MLYTQKEWNEKEKAIKLKPSLIINKEVPLNKNKKTSKTYKLHCPEWTPGTKKSYDFKVLNEIVKIVNNVVTTKNEAIKEELVKHGYILYYEGEL